MTRTARSLAVCVASICLLLLAVSARAGSVWADIQFAREAEGIVAAVIRNIADFSGRFNIQGDGLNAVADISLVLFVTMAVNGLKLYELVNLAVPMAVILVAQCVLTLLFAWIVIFLIFGKNYDTVMLAVGGVGFSMGATANGLAVMQGLSEKYGSNARAWLIVSLVGAFLIDLVNAIVITWMATL